MNFQRLEYFVALVNAGSVIRTSVILDVSQPDLSRQLALPEAEVGHRLAQCGGDNLSFSDKNRRV